MPNKNRTGATLYAWTARQQHMEDRIDADKLQQSLATIECYDTACTHHEANAPHYHGNAGPFCSRGICRKRLT